MRLSPHQELIVRSHTEDALEVEAVYQAGSMTPPVHLHPEQDERFEVLAGEITATVEGEERSYGAGERFAIPRGTPHTMWNGSDGETRVLWRTEPALDTLGWFEALAEAQRTGDYGPLGDALQAHSREIQFV
jgi:quercetin dioxygenase-like cupin family protein